MIYISNTINVHFLTKDSKELDEIINDRMLAPLMCFKTVKTFCDISQILSNCDKSIEINTPVYLFCGENDKLTPINITIEVFNNYKFKDKKVKIFSNGLHQLLFDQERKEMLKEIDQWILFKIKNSPNFG